MIKQIKIMMIVSAEINIVIHATEDHEKVLNIVKDKLGIDASKFTINKLEGHYGNEILFLKANLQSHAADDLAKKIINCMDAIDKEYLARNLEQYIDKNSLYLRISKQNLFKSKVTLDRKDAIKIRFKAKGFKPRFEEIRSMLNG